MTFRALIVTEIIRISWVSVMTNPPINITIINIRNFNNKTIINLSPIGTNIQSIHLIHSRFESIMENFTNSKFLGIITNISVDIIRTIRYDSNKICTIFKITEIIDIYRSCSCNSRIIFTITRISTTRPCKIILVDINLSWEFRINKYSEECTIMMTMRPCSSKSIEIMFMRTSIIIIIISVINHIIHKILDSNMNLFNGHFVINLSVSSRFSINGQIQVIISTNIFSINSTLSSRVNNKVCTIETGSQIMVLNK
mmetsp:Transcript_7981/g.12562  ORF Transcript_7981/g.12562 Transcript_7981/m.12562 type:complete len:255 (-) Transcript_7981:1861-2625(-)